MADDKQISEWRKYRRQSIQALPVVVGCLAVLCGILLVVNLFVSVPMWLATLLVGMAAFSVVGETINIIYLGRKLQRAKRDEGAGRLPNVF
jgi:uncharacterized membrane protein SirB2